MGHDLRGQNPKVTCERTRWGMAQRMTLTQRQIDVLRWIGDGCPDGMMVEEGFPERITAGALRNRSLVTTKGRGSTWSAAITEAGGEYLARVDGPNPPIPREPNRPVTQSVIDEIVAAGGTLHVTVRGWHSPPGTPDYEPRVANAERRGLSRQASASWSTRSGHDLRIDLRDAAEGTPTAASPVPVPGRVGRYHRVVTEFRGLEETHQISRAQLPRACRILKALVVEAERRGYGVGISAAASSYQRRGDRSAERGGNLVITVEGVAVTLHIRKEGVSTPSFQPSNGDWYRSTHTPARRSFAHERGASGQLRISLLAPPTRSNRQSSWGDGKTQVLEACLPAVLMEAETRSAEARERIRLEQLEAERRQQRGRRRWTDLGQPISRCLAQLVDQMTDRVGIEAVLVQVPPQLLDDVWGPQRPVEIALGKSEQRVSQVGGIQHAGS
jgi:hypothetical protein